jgi:hypothetical protein
LPIRTHLPRSFRSLLTEIKSENSSARLNNTRLGDAAATIQSVAGASAGA